MNFQIVFLRVALVSEVSLVNIAVLLIVHSYVLG